MLFIINDYADIAQLVDADGVHVGQDDFPVPEVRRLIGPHKLIGLSTHSPKQADAATPPVPTTSALAPSMPPRPRTMSAPPGGTGLP